MALRTVEVILPLAQRERLNELLEEFKVTVFWQQTNNEHIFYKLLINSDQIESVTDDFQKRFGGNDLRLVITDVEATLPRIEEKEVPDPIKLKRNPLVRISREELYNDMVDANAASWNFIILMVLSSIVAAIGILEENIAIIIGAMVIAPLLGPNVALSFGTTLGDLQLIRQSIITAFIGTVIALGVAIIWGFIDPNITSIDFDTYLRYSSIVLALVSGVAAVLSMLGGIAAAFVGVMVAVALLPPLIHTGLLLGGQYWTSALYTGLLFSANIICINLAGTITFLVAGIRPNEWWEAKKARKRTRLAIVAWAIFLCLLIGIMVYLKNVSWI